MLNNGYDCNWKFWVLITLLKVSGKSFRNIKAIYTASDELSKWNLLSFVIHFPEKLYRSHATASLLRADYKVHCIFQYNYYLYWWNIWLTQHLLHCIPLMSGSLVHNFIRIISFHFIYYHNHNSIFSIWQLMKLHEGSLFFIYKHWFYAAHLGKNIKSQVFSFPEVLTWLYESVLN